MNATLVFLLRLLLVLLSYTFVGWIGYLIFTDLKRMKSKPEEKFIPKIVLETDIDEQIMTMSFNKPEIIIGRDPTCDFVINDDRVSLHHCKIIYQQNQWWIEDLASTNGTFLNESFVNTKIVLINGDIIKLGHIEIKIIL